MSTPVPPVTCHILDTTRGKPAKDVACEIYYLTDSETASAPFATGITNADGRVTHWTLTSEFSKGEELGFISSSVWETLHSGNYKIRFNTKTYFSDISSSELTSSTGVPSSFAANRGATFFPFIDIVFEIPNPPDHHYHVPLLLSNYGYYTYRGS